MNPNNYRPHPIDTSGVRLYRRQWRSLTDRRARNTPNIWARQRMADGWR